MRIRGEVDTPEDRAPNVSVVAVGAAAKLAVGGLHRIRGILFLPLIAKALGPSDYGAWAQLGVALGLVLPIIDLGLGRASIRYLSGQGRERRNELFVSLGIIWIFLAAVALAIFLWRSPLSQALFEGRNGETLIFALLALLLLRGTSSFLSSYYRISMHLLKLAVIEGVTTLLSLGLGALLVLKGGGLAGLLTGVVSVEACRAVFVFGDVLRQTGLPRRLSGAAIIRNLSYGIPLIPNALLLWVIGSSDRLLIGWIMDLNHVGIYSASYSVAAMVGFSFSAISFPLLPLVSSLWNHEKRTDVVHLSELALRLFLLLAIPSACGIVYLGPNLLRELATESFVTGRPLLGVLVAGHLCLTVSNVYLLALILGERTKMLALVSFSAAALNVGLNLVLIPRHGMLGAAAATFAAGLVQLSISLWLSRREFRLRVGLRFLSAALVASGIMVAVLRAFTFRSAVSLIWGVVSAVFVYLLVMVVLGGIRRSDLHVLRRLLGRSEG